LNLIEFNQSPDEVAHGILAPCVHIPSWIMALVRQRPFASLDALYAAAARQAEDWQWSEVAQALAQHPRIGERRAAMALNDKEQQFSAREQGAVGLSDEVQAALLQGNHDYETRFGHIFLIRAAGRTSSEILSELKRRLSNSVTEEQAEVHEQLAEIALIRLKQEIAA